MTWHMPWHHMAGLISALSSSFEQTIEVVTITLDQTPVIVDNMGPEEEIESLAKDFSYNP